MMLQLIGLYGYCGCGNENAKDCCRPRKSVVKLNGEMVDGTDVTSNSKGPGTFKVQSENGTPFIFRRPPLMRGSPFVW
ncbi:MAG: hypothetical protein LBB18_04475 [Puniceicoccales bacterium]|jgi:hypothetical protein|nr:hypothetical protein [Puniceicoccales bacterium]